MHAPSLPDLGSQRPTPGRSPRGEYYSPRVSRSKKGYPGDTFAISGLRHRIATVSFEGLGKLLIGGAVVLLLLGGVFLLLGRFGPDQLPWDFVFRRGNFTVYAPIGLMILVSIVLTILLNVFFRR